MAITRSAQMSRISFSASIVFRVEDYTYLILSLVRHLKRDVRAGDAAASPAAVTAKLVVAPSFDLLDGEQRTSIVLSNL